MSSARGTRVFILEIGMLISWDIVPRDKKVFLSGVKCGILIWGCLTHVNGVNELFLKKYSVYPQNLLATGSDIHPMVIKLVSKDSD